MKKKKPEPLASTQQASGPSNAFSQATLEKAWSEFATSIEKESVNLYVTLTSRTPELKDNFLVVFLVDNAIQADDIHERKRELLGFLRKELNNASINLEVEVSETVIEKRAYTPVEKFQKLTEKNPAMQSLKQKLDLDFNY